MAKKIDSKLEKRLTNLGIKAKNEEEARKKLLARLEKEGVDGMEEEELDTLIEMVESFTEDDEVEEVDNEVEEVEDSEADDEEDDIEKLADEVEEEEESIESDDEEEEEVVEEKPKTKKTKPASTKKTEVKEKKATETPAKKTSKRGVKLDPKNNAEDRKAFEPLFELFGEGYQPSWITTHGLTIKHVGKNSMRGVLTLENATRHDDGRITCNLYLLTMAKETEKLDELGIDYELCWTKAPFMKNITLEEALEILEKVFDIIVGFVSMVDKRLGDNRKKMEDNLKKTGKSSKAIESDDEEEEEEVVEEKPKTKKTKPASTKKTKK